MHPILFQIGQFTLYTHGVLLVAGIIAAAFVVHLLAAGKNLDRTFLFDNVIYAVLFGIIGARLTYFLLYPDQFSGFKQIFFLWQGGLVSYGGFILGAIALIIILKLQHQPVLAWLDLFSVALPLGIFFGRIGDILAGEYFGLSNPGSSKFGGYLPVTLIEGIWDLTIFLALIIVFKKLSSRTKNGTMLALSIGLYAGGRFVIDFWRDEKDIMMNLSAGQLTSLTLLILATTMLIRQLIRQEKGSEYDSDKRLFRKTKKGSD